MAEECLPDSRVFSQWDLIRGIFFSRQEPEGIKTATTIHEIGKSDVTFMVKCKHTCVRSRNAPRTLRGPQTKLNTPTTQCACFLT